MKKKHIHFVGIKGVGMTPLALIAKEAGFTVTGSDIDAEFITDAVLQKAGIVILKGFSADHITTPDIVITTGAHGGYDNIEVQAAKAKHIPVFTQGQAVGYFMRGDIFKKKFTGISIAGTHGKTTTTAMLATIFQQNRLDPTYIIGTGDVGSLGTPGHFGKGRYFIAEADEYATEPKYDKTVKFLWQQPQIAIFTNIEFDHPDVFDSIDEIRDKFLQFANQLPDKGVLIACGDDKEIKNLLLVYKKRVITYGFNLDNNYVLQRVHISGDQTFFWVTSQGIPLGEFVIRVVGEHNALNALATVIASLESGLSIEKIKKGLLAFKGSKRRLEFMGDLRTGAKVYDDYAHHPTEIRTDLQALRKQYPKKKIIAIFQPHTYSRTKKLFDDFLHAFENADMVIITDIYASLREKVDPEISSKQLAFAMGNQHKAVLYLPSLPDVIKYISQNRFRSDTILVSMGAGDVYTIHEQLSFM